MLERAAKPIDAPAQDLALLGGKEVVALCMIATGTNVVKTSLARLLSSIVDFAPHHEVYLRADGAVAKRVDALERKPSLLRITVALDAYAGRSRRTMERGCPSRTAEPCLWTRYQLEKRVGRKGQLRGRHEALDKETGDK